MSGVQFLTAKLGASARLIVEMAFGADLTADSDIWTWTDVTTDVRVADGQKVVISPMGRSDSTLTTQPAGCAFQLKNSTGNYTAYNAASSHYPNVRRNTPVRVSVDLGDGNGAQVRFFGYANGFTPGWDASGRAAIVSVSASGELRRLGQGKAKLRSALYRAITTASTLPTDYWPCEDGSDGLAVVSAQNAIPNGSTLLARGASNFAASEGAPGSDRQPNFGAGGNLTGTVRGTETVTSWRIQCLVRLNTIDAAQFAVPLSWDTSDGNGWELDANSLGDGGLIYSDTFGNTFSSNTKIDDGLWHEWRVTAVQSGSNVALTVRVDGVSVIAQTLTSVSLTRITAVHVNPEASVSTILAGVGHFVVWNGTTTVSGLDTVDAMRGHAGEIATDRMTRLCAEQGEEITITGDCDATMGPQGVDSFVNLLRECEAADQGVLLDGATNGLSYIARQSRYNVDASLTVDASSQQLAQPFAPADDDQRNRNVWTVSRKNGGSATYEDTDGPTGTGEIGTYDDLLTLNVATDVPLLNYAGWLVHLGTVDGFRYPTIGLNFARSPSLAADWLATASQSRIDVTNVSDILTQHPSGTVSLLLEGYTETLSQHEWTVSANCSPYQPWRVIELAEDTGDTGEFICHLDTDGTTLGADVTQGATSLSLATASGPRWTTATDDFPLYLDVGGVKVKVTAISGTSSPQTATVDSTTVTMNLAGGTTVTVWDPPVLGL